MRPVVAWLGISLALLAALAVCGAAAAGTDLLAPSVKAHVSSFAVMASPHVAALALLARQRRSVGLGVALGAALAGLLAGIPRLVWAFQTGDTSTSGLGIASGFWGVLVLPVQILLASAAWRALRALAPGERLSAALLGASVAAPLLLQGLAAAVIAAAATDWGALRAQRTSEEAGRKAVDAIVRCANEHAVRHPEHGAPAALASLGPSGEACLDAETAAGHALGYRLSYLSGVADAKGRILRFAVCAQPVDVRRGAVHTFVAGRDGRVAAYVPRTVDEIESGQALPCAAPWFIAENDVRRGLEVCLLQWAAAHPSQGYPRTLRALGPEGDRCLADVGPTALSDVQLGIPPAAILYQPADPDERGVVTEFRLTQDPLAALDAQPAAERTGAGTPRASAR